MAWIDSLFRMMVERRASDLHLSTDQQPMLRESGEINPLEAAPKLTREQMLKALLEICPEHNRLQYEETHDTDFAYALEGCGRFRISLYYDRFGPGGVFRRIPDTIMTAEQLGLPPAILRLTEYKKGLVLVTGPTGSGKSTTLAAMIDYLNATRKDHIITIEDPIEFVHAPKKCVITQREVHHHTKSFSVALRASLRQDPDIVLVGEMRDLETTRIAIETAETGHLVFGTLHTSTAASTVDRVINQFPANEQDQIRLMLAGSLRGVVSQNLLRKRGGGRVAALEILIVTPGVSANIREGKTYQIPSAMQTGAKFGMCMLNDSLERLVRANTVDALDAYDQALDKEDMAKRLKALGVDVEQAMEMAKKTGTSVFAAPKATGDTKSIANPNRPPPAGGLGTGGWTKPST